MCVVDLDPVKGVTRLHDVIYVVLEWKRDSIMRFSATTYEQLTDIVVEGLKEPRDIVACERTSELYIAVKRGIWRVSSDGADVQCGPPVTYRPKSLSVTSTRLLVTFFAINQQSGT